MAESAGGFESIASFDADAVRESLRRTMVMGLPSEEDDQPTFYFEREVDWAKHDREGSPWDWSTAPVSETQSAPSQVLCAVEFFSPLGRQGAFYTEVGEFNPTTLVLTMFEDEFEEVYGFSRVTVGPSSQSWYFRFFKPAMGLGALTVYQVQCSASGGE